MRLTALPLLLALSSLAFAPAPLPRSHRDPQQIRDRQLRECYRRLGELGVKWKRSRAEIGCEVVQFIVERPSGRGSMSGSFPVDGDLLGTLWRVIDRVERYLRSP